MYLDSDPRSVLGLRVIELHSAREQREFQEWLERGARAA